MAFSATEMVLMAHGNNHKLYHYMTLDVATAVDTSGYFNGFADQLDIGDIIKVITVDSVIIPTTVSEVSEHVVLSNAAGVIDVSDTYQTTRFDNDF